MSICFKYFSEQVAVMGVEQVLHCCHISGKAKIPRIFLRFPSENAKKETTSRCSWVAMQESG